MRYFMWTVLAAALIVGTSVEPSKAIGEDAAAAPASKSETWRYRQHQGLWWYWLPSNKWVYWTDNHWVPYEAQSYAQLNASRRPAVTSNSGGTAWGDWGPIRYNSYGQPQYPYSQRQSGIRQLGPVPAPGGVRSLPGWGGER